MWKHRVLGSSDQNQTSLGSLSLRVTLVIYRRLTAVPHHPARSSRSPSRPLPEVALFLLAPCRKWARTLAYTIQVPGLRR